MSTRPLIHTKKILSNQISNMSTKNTTYEIFPIKIGSYVLDDNIQSVVRNKCFDICNNPKLGMHNSQTIPGPDLTPIQDTQSTLTHYYQGSHSLLDLEEFQEFHQWINKCSLNYIKNTLGFECTENLIVTGCWLNKCDSNGFQELHNHANSLVSGTYFVNLREGHAPIRFVNPLTPTPYNVNSAILTLPRRILTNEIEMPKREGTLLLWESHLNHYYRQNNADNRLSISFNVVPELVHDGIYGFRTKRI